MYFPQFHAIAENDTWWGPGFTDWHNVRSATPQFDGHYQPRVPLGNNYYDQCDLATLRWQVDLARRHGVYGFCHYHYWFDGRQLLQTPTNLWLDNPDIDLPFCLSWANETWTRRWDGRDHEVLIQQTHPPTRDSWRRHFECLIRAWTDPRAIKVDGKPVFAIYRPHRIPRIDDMLAYWRELARAEGLPGLYFVYQQQYELPDARCLQSFDAQFEFQPFSTINAPGYQKSALRRSRLYRLFRRFPERCQDQLRTLRERFVRGLTLHDYDDIWRHIAEPPSAPALTTYPGAFVDWDNTARYKERATVYVGASPDAFGRHMAHLVATMAARRLPENFIFLNAWNEWSEGAYLEPDQRYGCGYLEALKAVLDGAEPKAAVCDAESLPLRGAKS